MDISERAAKLLKRPIVQQPRCPSFCCMLLVTLTDTLRIWRCEGCDYTIRRDVRPPSPQGSLF